MGNSYSENAKISDSAGSERNCSDYADSGLHM